MKITNRMTRTLLGGGLGLVLGLALTVPAAAQSWTEINPTGGPPDARGHLTAVHNASSNRMIVFGGSNATQFVFVHPSVALRNDVWVLSNADGTETSTPTWTQLSPTGGSPSKRAGHSAVYDEANNRMIVFGGNTFLGGTFTTGNDVWVLHNADGTETSPPAWELLSPTGGPGPRWLQVAAYDPDTNRMIVFGGVDGCCNNPVDEIWVLENANGLGGTPQWMLLAATGTSPPVLHGRTGVYDPTTNRLIVLTATSGTSGLNDIRVLENANGLDINGNPVNPNWTQLSPTGGLPTAESGFSAVFDPATNRVVVFGGAGVPVPGGRGNEVWILDNANGLAGTPAWTQFSSTGTPPIGRDVHSAVFIQASNRMTVFGGRGCVTGGPCTDFSLFGEMATLNDVWVLDGLGAAAVTVTVDFDAVDTSGGNVSGAALDTYLAGFGITLTNVTGTFSPLVVISFATALTALGPNNVVAPSQPNILEQFGGPATSFTLEFATPLISFSFTRAGRCTPLAFPPWTAVAKDSSAVTLDTVGEGSGGTGGASCFSPTPAVGFTLSGPGIKSVTFSSGNFGFFGRSSPAIDDLVLTFPAVTPVEAGIEKQIASGPDEDIDDEIDVVVEVGQATTTEYDFDITYSNPGGPDVLIVDTIPAEWQVTEVAGITLMDGFSITDAELDGGGGTVGVAPANKKDNNKSATIIQWTPDPDGGTINVVVTTRESPGKGHKKKGGPKFRPTSCGPLVLNDGALVFELDEFGDPLRDPETGEVLPPIFESDPILLVAVKDLDGGGLVGDGSGDVDGDNLTDLDEVSGEVVTDPCDADTDGDGVNDDLDADPLDSEVQ